jgi:hypothetical protein
MLADCRSTRASQARAHASRHILLSYHAVPPIAPAQVLRRDSACPRGANHPGSSRMARPVCARHRLEEDAFLGSAQDGVAENHRRDRAPSPTDCGVGCLIVRADVPPISRLKAAIGNGNAATPEDGPDVIAVDAVPAPAIVVVAPSVSVTMTDMATAFRC